jgi:dihydrofolate reductase
MGIVLWHTTMSVDGFIAGPDHDMDWVFRYAFDDAAVEEVMRATGAILAGRNSFSVGERDAGTGKGSEAPYEGAWSGPQFVLTHRPPAEPVPGVTFLSGDIRAAVATGLEAADGRNLEVFGADIARQVVEAGLMDELHVHVVPLLLGDGVRLFGRAGEPPVELEQVSSRTNGTVTSLRYRFSR